jgi:hypothetical protein
MKHMKAVEFLKRQVLPNEVAVAPDNTGYTLYIAGFHQDLASAIPRKLYALIAQQPFFKGLDPHQLQCTDTRKLPAGY